MAYDEAFADRIRDCLQGVGGLTEKKMFGGVAWMIHGNMAVGIHQKALMVRLDPKEWERAQREPATRPFVQRDRPMPGFLLVDPPGTDDDAPLRAWVARGVAHTQTMPKKT